MRVRFAHRRIASLASQRRPLFSVVRVSGSSGNDLTFPKPETPCVFVNTVTDPYLNLAVEDFILDRRRTLNSKAIQLMVWRNQSSVIIGRNQNPWMECDLAYARRHGIKTARRSSGGGTVYHDLGNTNITIFAPEHKPERNLQFVISAMQKSFSLQMAVSPRKDIVFEDRKVRFSRGAMFLSLTASAPGLRIGLQDYRKPVLSPHDLVKRD